MIIKIILIAFGFGLTILVHELGHFIMARRAGVRVEVFSIGMGPWKWTFLERNGTKYILSFIPIGGYVKMLGQEDLPSGEKGKITDDHYLAKTPWQRMGIICAGVIMNLIFAFLVMLSALWIGIDFIPAEVGNLEVGSPAAAEGKFRPGDIITHMDGARVDTFLDVMTNVALGSEETIDFRVMRDGEEVQFQVKPAPPVSAMQDSRIPPIPRLGIGRPVSQKIGGVVEDSALFQAGLRIGMIFVDARIQGIDETIINPTRLEYLARLNPGKEVTIRVKDEEGQARTITSTVHAYPLQTRGFQTTAITAPLPGGPAEAAGIAAGDIIVSINGQSVRGWQDVIDITRKSAVDGRAYKLEIKRGDSLIPISVKPYIEPAQGRPWLGLTMPTTDFAKQVNTITWVDPELKDIPGICVPGDQIIASGYGEDGQFNVAFMHEGSEMQVAYAPLKTDEGIVCMFGEKRILFRKGFFSAFPYVFIRSFNELKRIYVFLGKLLTGRISHKLLGGPVRILNITYQVAGLGIGYLLYIFAVIGINLAVVNLLPIPVLDGGILMFLVYEIIRGKPASEKVQLVAQYVGLAFIALLFLFVTFNDIVSLIG